MYLVNCCSIPVSVVLEGGDATPPPVFFCTSVVLLAWLIQSSRIFLHFLYDQQIIFISTTKGIILRDSFITKHDTGIQLCPGWFSEQGINNLNVQHCCSSNTGEMVTFPIQQPTNVCLKDLCRIPKDSNTNILQTV